MAEVALRQPGRLEVLGGLFEFSQHGVDPAQVIMGHGVVLVDLDALVQVVDGGVKMLLCRLVLVLGAGLVGHLDIDHAYHHI